MVVQFEGILPEIAPRVAYAPVDLDGQVGVVVDVLPEVYEIASFLLYLVGSLGADSGSGIRHPLCIRKALQAVNIKHFYFTPIVKNLDGVNDGKKISAQYFEDKISSCLLSLNCDDLPSLQHDPELYVGT